MSGAHHPGCAPHVSPRTASKAYTASLRWVPSKLETMQMQRGNVTMTTQPGAAKITRASSPAEHQHLVCAGKVRGRVVHQWWWALTRRLINVSTPTTSQHETGCERGNPFPSHSLPTRCCFHAAASISYTHTSSSRPLSPRPPTITMRAGTPATAGVPPSSSPATARVPGM